MCASWCNRHVASRLAFITRNECGFAGRLAGGGGGGGGDASEVESRCKKGVEGSGRDGELKQRCSRRVL